MVDLQERLTLLFPSITFGPDISECDCVIKNSKISRWGRSEDRPTEGDLVSVEQSSVDNAKNLKVKKSLIESTKEEAKRRIKALLPIKPESDYRDVEANMLARVAELLNLKIDGLLPDQTELNQLNEIWDKIKAVRAASDLIENEIENGSITSSDGIKASAFWA
jgi:hypothetical protein